MATQIEQPYMATGIESRLGQLRRRIKAYIWIEAISLILIWLGATFWIGLAVDYLPVLVGASEMPRGARIVLLAIIAAILAYVIYRWIFQRALVRLPDHSMAVLLERRFGQFHDSLVTSVELGEQPDHAAEFNSDMLSHTQKEALAQVDRIRVREVLRSGPLLMKVLLAVLILLPFSAFYDSTAVTTWAKRLYLLRDEPWPRNTQLSVAGIQIQRAATTDGDISLSDLIPFGESKELKVAKGTSVLLKVKALADDDKVVPEYCTVYYRTAEGDRGSVTMQKLGLIRFEAETKSQYQTYVCDSKPFRGILSSITFDVRGLDHRVRDFRLTVVDSPVIVETQLDCVFPSYMVNEELSTWLPRTMDLASGTRLPVGTHITMRSQTNKDLTKVELRNLADESVTTIDIPQGGGSAREFNYIVDQLGENLSLEAALFDTDGVVSDPPIRLYIGGIEDQPPVVKATLRGIGTAVTPDVVIPAMGEITDDYDVDRSWFEATINDSEAREYPFPLGEAGKVEAELDFRAERAADGGVELKPKDKLSITVVASDKCDLKDNPNVGSGDRYQLDVVTPEELIAMLERKELGLRRRLEQIIDELNETRDTVSRLKRDDEDRGTAPEDRKVDADTADADQLGQTAEERAASLRLLRTQRSIVQSDKSAQEVLGVAASFADIREELINNRVDSKDREARIKEQIADPLRLIGENMFPVLNRQLQEVEKNLADPAASDEAVDLAVEQADAILLELDKVLQMILELETYNELMNIVRSLIEDQAELIERTKEEQKKGARELLK